MFFLKSPVVQLASALEEIMTRMQLNDLLKNLVRMMIKNRRLAYLKDVLDCFLYYVKSNAGVSVLIESAQALDKKTQKIILDLLSVHANGAILQPEFRVEPSLIAGFVIKLESKWIDLSLKTQLNHLWKYMKGMC
jgi:F-type H+-transporting ATPase subunit delta